MADEQKENQEITDEQFAAMCVQNVLWKFLYVSSCGALLLGLSFVFGITVNVTWPAALTFLGCFVGAYYFFDMLSPGRSAIFTQDFYVWAVDFSEKVLQENKRKNLELLKLLKNEAEAEVIELEIEDDKIKHYGRRLEAISSEKMTEDFNNLLNTVEEFHNEHGRDYVVKALGDILVAYSESIGSDDTTITTDGYVVSIRKIKEKEKEKEEE